jgi:hypothetical protein
VKRGCEFVGCTVLPMGLVIGAFWAVVFAWVPSGKVEGGRVPLTVIGTVLGTAVAAFAYLAVENARALRRLGRARRGEAPADGVPVTFGGVLEARTDEVLEGPFSGRTALAYRYRVTRSSRDSHGRLVVVTAFEGEAMVPTLLRTDGGEVSLLGRPGFEQGFDGIEGEGARKKAQAFLEAKLSEAEAAEAARTEAPKAEVAAGGAVDEPAAFEKHEQLSAGRGLPRPLDLTGWGFLEAVCAPGETVCVSGTWSAERGGLAAPKGGTEGLLVERGTLAEAASRRWGMLAKVGFAGVFLLALQAGFVYVVWTQFR